VSHEKETEFTLHPIGVIRSTIINRKEAPRQGGEGAPDVWLEVDTRFADALDDTHVGDDIIVLTFLHQSRRETLKVHPRSPSNPLTGVFATRSPDRPNPVGLHRVTVREINGMRLRVGPMEAIDGTPVIDIKPVLSSVDDF
jgi:tRNA-Thr(GGU) m(6)t(6)A37 methyltransferase TsaA